MSGALVQLWGMINGLQLFVHIPLFEISMPANAKLLVDSLTAIATFDIVEAQTIFGGIIEFPDEDEDDLNPKFVESGYDHRDMI